MNESSRARVRALAVSAVVTIVLVVAGGTLFWSQMVHTVARIDSPGGRWTAVVRVISLGGNSTHVLVSRRGSWLPSRQDKVFVADNPDAPGGPLDLRVAWEDDNRLLIAYPQKARVLHQQSRVGQITVQYQTY